MVSNADVSPIPFLQRRLTRNTHVTGDIFYLEILGRKIVIVNNYEMANELMDKRSANYSDRPVFPLFMKCVAHLRSLSPHWLLTYEYETLQPRLGC